MPRSNILPTSLSRPTIYQEYLHIFYAKFVSYEELYILYCMKISEKILRPIIISNVTRQHVVSDEQE